MKYSKKDLDSLKFFGGAKDGEELPFNGGELKKEIFFDRKPITSYYDSAVFGSMPKEPRHPSFYVYQFSHIEERSAYYYFDRVQ